MPLLRIGWFLLILQLTALAAESDWPMLGHDAARTGVTSAEVRPPFDRKWYRLFADEGIMSGVQPIVADGKVLVGTLRGKMHAMDQETGRDIWVFQAGGAILHSTGAGGGQVVFGSADSGIYALSLKAGTLTWKVATGAAVWNAPAIHDGLVLIGSRDRKLYALDLETGKIRWTAPTGGPLLCSPTVDPRRGCVYIGSEDMGVYAFRLSNGEPIWRSEKLPGVSLRGYHPVVAPDGTVLVTSAPAIGVDRFQDLMVQIVKEVFGDFASWRHSKEENAKWRAANFKLMEKLETYTAQLEVIRRRLAAAPVYQTFFALDPATGKQKFVAPIVYSESMNGPGAPALVSPDGKVIVKYQALLRSRYEHYSPFLNPGYLDTATGHITPVMDQSRTYGWHDSLLLVHDEQSQLALGGRVLLNTHQDNVNGMDLESSKGFPAPFCVNIHEPQPGEAMGIWMHLLRGQPLPVGKEWLARGTAVYGGGSVIDVPIAIAGDSFYYLPTHEINAGAAVIAYRMNPDGKAAKGSPVPKEKLAAAEWNKVRDLPWDWDTIEFGRLNHVLAALPGKAPGTRQAPLTNDAAHAVAKITDAELDQIIWEMPSYGPPAHEQPVTNLNAWLVQTVGEITGHAWQPLVFPAGKHPEESYQFFNEPTETLYTLALIYPHTTAEMQAAIRKQVKELTATEAPLGVETGRRTYLHETGEVRSAYAPPPPRLVHIQDGILRSPLARLYPLWLWAQVTDDWRKLKQDWPKLKPLLQEKPNPFAEDCRNGYLAGLIAYCRIAHHLDDSAAVAEGVSKAREAFRDRLRFELAHTRGGLIWPVPKLRSAFSRWHFLTPEVGRLLRTYAEPIHRHLMGVYVDHHRPTWWLAWNVETLMRNECPYELPTTASDIFAARRWILEENASELAKFVDLPWCAADEYYAQKLAWVLGAARQSGWSDLRQ